MPRPIEKGVYWKRERQINEVETEMGAFYVYLQNTPDNNKCSQSQYYPGNNGNN